MPSATPLIFNPAAGGGRGHLRFREAESLLAARGIDVEPIETQAPRHATTIARELAADGKGRILAIGGDGTVSETCNGVLQSGKSPELGFLPAGTGNDFLRDFEITKREQAIDHIALGKPRHIDAGRISYEGQEDAEDENDRIGRFFMNIFGVGFAPESVILTNRYFKWAKGQAYNLGVLAKMAGLRPTPTRLVLDGEETMLDAPMVMVCNSIHTGGAMKMAPMARQDDGLFDVMTVEDVNRRQLIGLLGKVREGGHVRHKSVHFHRAKNITIDPESAGPLLADGEVFGATPVDLEMMPGALRILL